MTAKILHLSTVHPVDDVRIFQKEVRALRLAGYQVVVAGIRTPAMAADIEPACIFDPIRSRTRRVFVSFQRVMQVCAHERPDILHFHDPEILLALPFVRRYCKHVIYDSHEHVSEQMQHKGYLPSTMRPAVGYMVAWFERNLVRFADAVVTPTPHIADYFRSLGKTAIEVANYPDRASLPPLNDISTRKAQAVCTGGLSPFRGLAEMLAAAHMTGHELHLAGYTDPQGRALLQEAQDQPSIHFHGWMSRYDALTLQQQSMVGLSILMPTAQYLTTIPTKVFEYLAMGLVVICSDFAFLRSLFAGFSTIRFINPYDVKGIASAWAQAIAEYPSLTQNLVASRDQVLKDFTWESQAEKLSDLYSKLLR
jgi:glycosyltransferase involved in cell wall biosynthesis